MRLESKFIISSSKFNGLMSGIVCVAKKAFWNGPEMIKYTDLIRFLTFRFALYTQNPQDDVFISRARFFE